MPHYKIRTLLILLAVGRGEYRMLISDYTIAHEGIEWETALRTWSWLIPNEFTHWIVSRFADLYVVTLDDSIHQLLIGEGTFTKVAENRADFAQKIDNPDTANDWLMIPLVDQLVAAGMSLQAGQCYGFRVPPMLGGEYSVRNCVPIAITDYLGAYGSIHEQLRDVSEGTQVVLKPIDLPKKVRDVP